MAEEDTRLIEAKAIPMDQLADRLQIKDLVRTAGELVGPCPGCGGTDRFSINPRKGVIFCRGCDAKGDQVALVQLTLGMDFRAALDWLVGPRQELTPQQQAEQRRRADAFRRQREADAARHRADAIRQARDLERRPSRRRYRCRRLSGPSRPSPSCGREVAPVLPVRAERASGRAGGGQGARIPDRA